MDEREIPQLQPVSMGSLIGCVLTEIDECKDSLKRTGQISFRLVHKQYRGATRQGKCKVKDLNARTEDTVDVSDLVKTLRSKGVVPVGCEFAMEMLNGESA